MSIRKKEKTWRDYLKEFWFIGVLIISTIAIVSIWWYNMKIGKTPDYWKIDEVGQFGDRFGFSTSLFGGVTIILLLITIQLQRMEIVDGKKEFKQQNRTLKYQKFDNTFFNLVDLHHEIISTLPNGRNSFVNFGNEHLTRLATFHDREEASKSYKANSSSVAKRDFGHYISNFELIVDYVLTRKKKDGKARLFYLRTYFAQLTSKEKVFLLYHYNLDDKPKNWNIWKSILFRHFQSNHLHQPPHANFLDPLAVWDGNDLNNINSEPPFRTY